MTEFTLVSATIGGAMIGLAAVLLMALNGRIMGVSGIAKGLFSSPDSVWRGRLAFLIGTMVAPLLVIGLTDIEFPAMTSSPMLLIGAGLLVGFGSGVGSGCTSGHGICGLSRLSLRSLVATCTFMITAIATVFITRHLL